MKSSCGDLVAALRNANNNNFVKIKFSEIPAYLHDGEFYKSLNEENEGDSEVEVPRRCFRLTAEVHYLRDFELMLQVVAFWGLNTIPECLIRFCADKPMRLWADILDQMGSELSFTHELRNIFSLDRADALPIAINCGKTEVVEFLAKHEDRTERGAVVAARCGRVDYLALLHHHNHPWHKDACSAAAEGGHLDCLMYLHENGCPWDHHVFINAAQCDSMPCIEYAYENSLSWYVDTGIAFAKMKRFDVLIYAIQRGCPLHSDMMKYVAHEGNSECLQYLLHLNCPTVDAMHFACQEGSIDKLQLLHEHGVPWHKNAAAWAVFYNQLECLQYLHENGCPWDEVVSTAAAKCSYIDILRYCLDNGCPYNEHIVEDAANRRLKSALECVRYLTEDHGIYMNENGELFATAFGNANVELMTYLLDIGCPHQDYFNFTPLHVRTTFIFAGGDSSIEMELLDCVKLAAAHCYNFSNDFLQLLCAEHPLCMEYLKLEGYV